MGGYTARPDAEGRLTLGATRLPLGTGSTTVPTA